jgi:murein DD-endopeptidase MepM/ murein hydrolase activator NlpD
MVSRPSPVGLVVCVALAVTAVMWMYDPTGVRDLVRLYFGTPHERYAAGLRLDNADGAARAWLEAAERSITSPASVRLPQQRRVLVTEDAPEASAFIMSVKRGQWFIADADIDGAKPGALFLDVFVQDGPALRHVASAAKGSASIAVEVRADADYVLRVQPALRQTGTMALALHTEPTLRFPVEGATAKSVQSFFGAARDGGRRAHHGVDIFAARGTPVRAAAGGIVTSVGPNGLGGNTIWITRPTRGESHYYAHLDRQLVAPGTYVNEGDVIGLVGNTGNARTTAPHLHFGIYTTGGAVDPFPYLAAYSARTTRQTALPTSSATSRAPRASIGEQDLTSLIAFIHADTRTICTGKSECLIRIGCVRRPEGLRLPVQA